MAVSWARGQASCCAQTTTLHEAFAGASHSSQRGACSQVVTSCAAYAEQELRYAALHKNMVAVMSYHLQVHGLAARPSNHRKYQRHALLKNGLCGAAALAHCSYVAAVPAHLLLHGSTRCLSTHLRFSSYFRASRACLARVSRRMSGDGCTACRRLKMAKFSAVVACAAFFLLMAAEGGFCRHSRHCESGCCSMVGHCARLLQHSLTWDLQHGTSRQKHHDKVLCPSGQHGTEQGGAAGWQDSIAATRHGLGVKQQAASAAARRRVLPTACLPTVHGPLRLLTTGGGGGPAAAGPFFLDSSASLFTSTSFSYLQHVQQSGLCRTSNLEWGSMVGRWSACVGSLSASAAQTGSLWVTSNTLRLGEAGAAKL